jgi:hypothetical protein
MFILQRQIPAAQGKRETINECKPENELGTRTEDSVRDNKHVLANRMTKDSTVPTTEGVIRKEEVKEFCQDGLRSVQQPQSKRMDVKPHKLRPLPPSLQKYQVCVHRPASL